MVFFYKKCEVCGNKMSILKISLKNSTALECKNCKTKYQAKETVLYTAVNFLLEDLDVFIILFYPLILLFILIIKFINLMLGCFLD